ncbi:MAG: gliding motility protein GldN [Flavobacterium sp.]
MNCKNLLSVVLLVAGSFTTFAQSNLLNAKVPSEIGKKSPAQLNSDNDKPLAYGYVDDRDVLFGKAVWEIIDLNERINFPLYYPIDTANIGKDRRSLFDVLLKNIKSGKITEVYGDSYFNDKRPLKDIEHSFKYIDTLDQGRDEINNNPDLYKPMKKKDKKGNVVIVPPARKLDPQYIDERELTAQDVSSYKIKGFWYFDKRQGELKYRLLGICPMAPEAKEIGNENPDLIELFWVYYPAIRDITNKALAFNDRNSAMPLNFDSLLNSRRFNAVIYQEENVFGDRLIEEYLKDNAQMELLESERIKEKIRDFEQDMWTY